MTTRTQRAILTDILELGLDPSEAHNVNERNRRLESTRDSVNLVSEEFQSTVSVVQDNVDLVEIKEASSEEQVTSIAEEKQSTTVTKTEAKKPDTKKVEKSAKETKKTEEKTSS